MNKKAITLICLMSTFSLLGGLTSCGPVDNTATEVPNTTEQGSGTSETPDVPKPTGKKVKIEFWHTFGQGIQGVIEKKIRNFEALVLKNEGVEVEVHQSYQGGYDDIKTKIEKGFSAGNVPTIAVAYPDHVANYLASEKNEDGKYVTNLDNLINDEKIGFGTDEYLGDTYGSDDFVPAFFDEGTHFAKPGTYTLPFMKSSEVMFYNTEAVERALKLRDPNFAQTAAAYLKDISWDEFMELNEFILDHKAEVLSTLDKPFFYDSDSNLFISKMFQNNIPFSTIDENGKGHVAFEEEAALAKTNAMVRKLKTSYDKGLITTKGVEKTYGSDSFVQGKSVFTIGSSGGAGYNIPTSKIFTVGIAKVPYDNNNPLYVTQGPCLTMLKNPAHTTEDTALRTTYGWKFVKYLLEPETNVEVCINGSQGYIPVRQSAFETDAYLEFLVEGEDFAKTANVLLDDINGRYLNTGVFPGSAELRDIAGSIITQSLLVKTNTDIDAEIAKIIKTAIDNAKLSM